MLSVGDEVIIENALAAEESGASFVKAYDNETPLLIKSIDPDDSLPYIIEYEGKTSYFSEDELRLSNAKDQQFLNSLYKEA